MHLASSALPCRGLSETAVRTLADGSHIDSATLYRQMGGNAFFVTEVLAAGTDSGIPATVRDAVRARASRLSAPARHVLEAAAVIGPRVPPALLAEVSGAEPAATDECLSRGMLSVEGDTLAFRHDLARQAMLESLSPTRRADLHQAVVRAMRAQPPAQIDLAHLTEHADAAADAESVLEFAPPAARRAAQLGAPQPGGGAASADLAGRVGGRSSDRVRSRRQDNSFSAQLT